GGPESDASGLAVVGEHLHRVVLEHPAGIGAELDHGGDVAVGRRVTDTGLGPVLGWRERLPGLLELPDAIETEGPLLFDHPAVAGNVPTTHGVEHGPGLDLADGGLLLPDRGVGDPHHPSVGGGTLQLCDVLGRVDDVHGDRRIGIGHHLRHELGNGRLEGWRPLTGPDHRQSGGEEAESLGGGETGCTFEVVGGVDHHLVLVEIGLHEITGPVARETADEHGVQVLEQLVPGVSEAVDHFLDVDHTLFQYVRDQSEDAVEAVGSAVRAHASASSAPSTRATTSSRRSLGSRISAPAPKLSTQPRKASLLTTGTVASSGSPSAGAVTPSVRAARQARSGSNLTLASTSSPDPASHGWPSITFLMSKSSGRVN